MLLSLGFQLDNSKKSWINNTANTLKNPEIQRLYCQLKHCHVHFFFYLVANANGIQS